MFVLKILDPGSWIQACLRRLIKKLELRQEGAVNQINGRPPNAQRILHGASHAVVGSRSAFNHCQRSFRVWRRHPHPHRQHEAAPWTARHVCLLLVRVLLFRVLHCIRLGCDGRVINSSPEPKLMRSTKTSAKRTQSWILLSLWSARPASCRYNVHSVSES